MLIAKQDKPTLQRINLLHPKLRDEALKIYEEAEDELKNFRLRFTYTLRTFQEQELLFSQGRTRPGKIVTNARAGKSFHNYGLACFDENTRIFTNKGLKYFYELDGSEEVLSFKDNNLTFEKPTAYISNEYEGDLVRIKSRSVDLAVTPNHKMIVQKKINNKWEESWSNVLAENITSSHRIPTSGITTHNEIFIPKFQYYKRILNIENSLDWFEFLGYYISEGSSRGVSNGIPRTDSSRFSVKISQYKDKNIEVWTKIKNCLDRLNFKYSYQGHDFIIHSKALWELLFPMGNCYQKRIPEYMFKANKEHLEKLYYALIDGDGTYYDNGEAYFTVNKNLAEDVSLLSLLLNKSNSIYSKEPNKNHILPDGNKLKTFNTQYIVRTRTNNTQELRRGDSNSLISKEYYKGMVYCVTTNSGAVVVERNGKISVCGNCDICLLSPDGKMATWDTVKDFDGDGIADWFEVVAVFKKYGWEAGIDWKTFKDAPHFQKAFGYNIHQLLDKYKAGDFIPGTKYLNI